MKPVCSEISYWHEKEYLSELFDSTNFPDLSPVTQVKAVCFTKNDCVLSVKKGGELIFPGGGIEKGESYEEALRRELKEEASLLMIDYGPSCYLKITKQVKPLVVSYHVRFWAEVELLDEEVVDPDGKSIDRLVVPVRDFYKHISDEKRRKIFDFSSKLYSKVKKLRNI